MVKLKVQSKYQYTYVWYKVEVCIGYFPMAGHCYFGNPRDVSNYHRGRSQGDYYNIPWVSKIA